MTAVCSVGRRITYYLLLLCSSAATPPSSNTSYCPSTQRYDTGTFPPKCFDCPRVIPNRMQMAQIPTQLLSGARRPAQKFSPGLPQNQTCGCWRAPANQTFEIVLNASWVVSGFVFSSERTRWLKEFDVQASDDNRTFLPWGSFSMSNFTAASLALFSLPIRARFFRVTVSKYAHHYVNTSSGFLLTPVQALVSRDQPFTCACPMLASGACCPFINMTVRNDVCEWCMDPGDIMTRVIDGCGKCKPGTFEHAGRCYPRVPVEPINSLSVGRPSSNGVDWRVEVNHSTDPRSVVMLFVANRTQPHPCAGPQSGTALSSACCLLQGGLARPYVPVLWNFTPPQDNANAICRIEASLNPPHSVRQFVQFDRGRGGSVLSFSEMEIRDWAACTDDGVCTGVIGALFLTTLGPLPASDFVPQLIQQPLRFDLRVPTMVCATLRLLPEHPRAELHYYAATDTYTVRTLGVVFGEKVWFQWTRAPDSNVTWTLAQNSANELVVSAPPPLASLRLTDRITTLRIDPPLSPVVHGAVTRSASVAILVEITYGFGFSALPAFGDTDQIILVTARSTQPARLRRLLTTARADGQITAYTNAKGFIADTRRVLDLGIACYQDKTALHRWLLQALQLLDTNGLPYVEFARRSCQLVTSGEVAKAYWLVPWRGPIVDRTAAAGVDVLAEFA